MRLSIPCTLALALASVGCASAQSSREGGAVAYTVAANPTSGVQMLNILLPERPDVERRVNDQLDALAASFVCDDLEADGGKRSYNSSASVAHAANDVFSVLIGISYYCGGPYPTNHADSSITFDLRTGEAVRFRALFEDYERDRTGISRAFVESLSAEDLDRCPDVLTVEELAGQTFAYTISTAGLRMEPTFPHVLEACNRDSIVPFDALRAFAAPAGVLTRVADARP